MSSVDRTEYIRRFRREAQAAARCAHPNIVAIYDFATHEGQPFIAMEFVYGMSVRQMIDGAPDGGAGRHPRHAAGAGRAGERA